ncbi:MAG: helix-turn-helix transcriptional regulator [Paludibacteraceae bacterium]|nr:helix-turn-helix transcriptional regulator [Paludibacteraceae bacterium]
MIDIQKNIRAILADRGIMQKQVALKLGMTDQALSNWFTRKTDLTFTQIQRICEVTGVELVDVVTYPKKYVPEDQATAPVCEECRKKDEIIDNLNLLIKQLKQQK